MHRTILDQGRRLSIVAKKYAYRLFCILRTETQYHPTTYEFNLYTAFSDVQLQCNFSIQTYTKTINMQQTSHATR